MRLDPGQRRPPGRVTTAPGESPVPRDAPDRFAEVCRWLWRRLPRRLQPLVPVTVIGFALINGATFSIDLGLLAALGGPAGLHHAVAISVAYGIAFSLAFVLNRWLNFQSHGPVGDQVGRYAVVVSINFSVLVLGLASALVSLGAPLLVARLVAGAAEAVWMYATMRWWVFRDQGSRVSAPRGRR